MTKPADLGQAEAHTRADPATAEAAWQGGSADPADLIEGLPDATRDDVLLMAAELVAAPRRARGRPAGAGNRKNADMIAYLATLGHRDPWMTLSLIQTADTVKLANMLRVPLMKNGKQQVSKAGTPLFSTPDPMAVLGVQERAAARLMDYHHAKKPQQLDLLPGAQRPLMVIGEMNVTIASENGLMSAGLPLDGKANEINGDVVREDESISHDDAK